MEVVKDEQIVESGDIAEWLSGQLSIVTERELQGNVGLNGVNLDGKGWACDMQAHVNNGNARLYKASEYELVLRRKEGE